MSIVKIQHRLLLNIRMTKCIISIVHSGIPENSQQEQLLLHSIAILVLCMESEEKNNQNFTDFVGPTS